jgi:hypothetical protein
MKLITEEVQKVKFITEGKGIQKKMFIGIINIIITLATLTGVLSHFATASTQQ